MFVEKQTLYEIEKFTGRIVDIFLAFIHPSQITSANSTVEEFLRFIFEMYIRIECFYFRLQNLKAGLHTCMHQVFSSCPFKLRSILFDQNIRIINTFPFIRVVKLVHCWVLL